MRGDLRPQIVGIGDDVQDAGWQDILHEFRQAKRGKRRGGGGLHHQGIPGDQRRAQLEAEQDQRKIPGDDGTHHAQGRAVNFDPPRFAVLEHFHWHFHRGKMLSEHGEPIGLGHGLG